MPDDPADSSPRPDRRRRKPGGNTRIEIDGNPAVSVDIELEGGQLPGGDATLTRVVNAVAPVCNAALGVRRALDLVIASRGFQLWD
jgi:hypothetical protein